MNNKIVPFLKWAGGKRWLAHNHSDLFPTEFDKYIEPFLGGGAIYFSLKPKNATLSDLNENLINTYRAVKRDAKRIEQLLRYHQRKHNEEYYYEMRGKKLRSDLTKAAQFIYLNRTCWNGLYRVNLNGKFNVPIGTKTTVVLPDDNFKGISKLLKRAKLINRDFESVISSAKENDFLFVDPPYTVKHNNNNFRKYNERIFSWNDQIRLRNSVFNAKERGVKILICNANNVAVRNLYSGFGKIKKIYRSSRLASDPINRHNISEIVISSNNF